MQFLSTLEISSDSENKLLSRRELKFVFKGASGLLTRQGAAEAIAAKVGVAKENVQIISLKGSFGIRDLSASAFIYSDLKLCKRQLPEYILTRQLPKDERKKAKEEKKKAKSSSPGTASSSDAKQVAAADKKS